MKYKNVSSCVKEIIKGSRGYAVALAVSAVLGVAVSLAPPQIMRVILDDYLLPANALQLYKPALMYLSAILLIGALDFIKGCLLSFFAQRCIRELRSRMLRKLFRLKASYFSEQSPGSVVSRINTDVDSINSLFSDGLVSMFIDCLKIIGIGISMWLFSWRLALLTLLIIIIVFAITRFFRKRMYAAQINNLRELSNVNGHIAESVKNISMIKLFSKESYMEEKYCRALRENYKTRGRVIIYDSCYSPIIQLIRAVVIAVIVALTVGQSQVLGISAGMLAASIDLISSLLLPIEALGTEIQNIQSGLSGIGRIEEFLSLDEETKDSSISAAKVLQGCEERAVCFEHMSFSYISGTPVLTDISTEIKKGESITIAGRTGVGKSTIFNLIMGLLTPTEGRLVIGGFDAYLIPNEEKRAIFGYVEQSFRFIPGTVEQQISLGDPTISRRRVIDVCRQVGLHESIEALSDGYDTLVSSDTSFSWGQCQLLSIARAVAAQPPILLLDEITANLDSATEAMVMRARKSVSEGRTVISISHRESAMLECDRLIFLENGKIAAQGSPQEVFKVVKSSELL